MPAHERGDIAAAGAAVSIVAVARCTRRPAVCSEVVPSEEMGPMEAMIAVGKIEFATC